MEERGNKTIMCSVFFLDIVGYSKKSVAGQILLKDRFNNYLSAAIRDVPMTDRIILDTGDGAAINFLGDVEDALKAALSLRESLLAEDPNVDQPLLVRMGINLGPVRLVRDINGQPNIVGDGINVAQRVMGFADAAQILVSRSYYDAVSRLSPQYAGMFHYQGSRTDKHVREHEVYAIGYPGDKTTNRGAATPLNDEAGENLFDVLVSRAKTDWYAAINVLDGLTTKWVERFQQADSKRRALYIGVVAVPLLLFVALLINLIRHDQAPVLPETAKLSAKTTQQPVLTSTPVAPAANVVPVQAISEVKSKDENPAPSLIVSKPKVNKSVEAKTAKIKPKVKPKEASKEKHEETQPKVHTESHEKTINKADAEKKSTLQKSGNSTEATIVVNCNEGTEVFVDGVRKGRVSSLPLTVVISPGAHTVIISHTSRGIFTQSVELNVGQSLHIKPGMCN